MKQETSGFIEWVEKRFSYSFISAINKISVKDYIEIITVLAKQYERDMERKVVDDYINAAVPESGDE